MRRALLAVASLFVLPLVASTASAIDPVYKPLCDTVHAGDSDSRGLVSPWVGVDFNEKGIWVFVPNGETRDFVVYNGQYWWAVVCSNDLGIV